MSYLTNWDENIILFTKEAKAFLYQNDNMKELSKIDLREKIDFYTMEIYGRVDNTLDNIDFEIKRAIAHSKKILSN